MIKKGNGRKIKPEILKKKPHKIRPPIIKHNFQILKKLILQSCKLLSLHIIVSLLIVYLPVAAAFVMFTKFTCIGFHQ